MTSVSVNNINSSGELNNSFLDSLAKKGLFKALNNLHKGRLVIEDNGEVYCFGDNSEVAEIIANITINHQSSYRNIIRGGSIGAAEAYMLGLWSSPNLPNVMRLMALNLTMLKGVDNKGSLLRRLATRLFHRMNNNSTHGSRKNISAHYDLGNDFFSLFLDSSMMYSSAIYPSPETSLEQASIHKLDSICKKLRLSPSDHLLEIGTGWGGLAIYAAKNYGCKVSTTTISKEQYEYAKLAVKKAGLEQQITLLLKDYRDLEGQYDKLVSIEMIEAVGHEYYQSYFKQCSRLLQPDGLMLIQAITIADQRYQSAKASVDFIQRYIFPGGCLPSNEIIAQCVSKYTDMMIINHHDIGLDYARTLADWRRGFHQNIDSIKAMGFDDVFCRMWEYYLCYCEGGFMERAISTAQIVMAKPGARVLTPLV